MDMIRGGEEEGGGGGGGGDHLVSRSTGKSRHISMCRLTWVRRVNAVFVQELEKRRRVEDAYKNAMSDLKIKSHYGGPDYEVDPDTRDIMGNRDRGT